MLNRIRRFLPGGLLAALAIGFAGSATALPAVQLGPGDPPGDWTYDWSTQTWTTDTNPFEIEALANATKTLGGGGKYAWDGAAATQTAYLVIAAVPMIAFNGFDITIENDGGALAMIDSGYGAPPVADPNDLAPHGIFDTYFEIYAFDFDDVLVDIYDTQPGEIGAGKGYIEVFNVTINSLAAGVTGVHLDLFTLEGDGIYDVDNDGGIVKTFAPFSHDATFVPEPTGAVLFSIGLLVVGSVIRRSR